MIGQTISHYRVLGTLGKGGMGVVYEAEDIRLGRRVALKLLPENFVSDSRTLQRFEREARAASSLNHPGICTIYEVEEYEHQPVIVMELLEGESLKEKIRTGAMAPEEVVEAGIQISDALDVAHRKGIVHRDIKPANLFTVNGGRVKILDFGLAKAVHSEIPEEKGDDASLTVEGVIPGTTAYMSPEQVRGDEIDGRSDLFSLGIVLYEMSTGKRPFAGKNRIVLMDAILNAKAVAPREVNPLLPEELSAVILHCLDKNRERRYQNGAEIVSDLKRLRAKTESGVGAAIVSPPAKTPARSGWLWWSVALAGLGVLGIAGGLYWRVGHRQQALTQKDTIVLADFANSTGDAVFDGTLRRGLTIQLEQSPFLSLISESRIQQTLRLMGQPEDARLTPEVAREICERTGSAAVVDGSIANLGSQYIVGLRAKACRTGDVVAEEQAQAARKEDVLNALGKVAGKLRTRLGESLTTVEEHNTPLEVATTPSLDALKAYSMGMQVAFSTGFSDSIPFLKRAVEIDPKFATAYASLGLMYSVIGESALAVESTKKAYELRDHASDRERFFITTLYLRNATGNLEKEKQTLRQWGQTYPRDRDAHGLLSGFASQGTGQFEESIEQANIALGIDPDFTPAFPSIAYANFFLGRIPEAEKTIRQATERKRDTAQLWELEYYIAFDKGDKAGMDRVVATAKDKPEVEDLMLHSQALVAAYSGRLREAVNIWRRAADMARQTGHKEGAATYIAAEAVSEALFGDPANARRSAIEALALSKGRDAEYAAAFALAVGGDIARSQAVAADLQKRFPEDTSVQFNYLPALRGVFALNRRDPRKAIDLLQAAIPNELGVSAIDFNEFFGGVYPIYVRGKSYLEAGQPAEAAAEFHKLLTHRGMLCADPVGALAHLQLGRAYVNSGDASKAKAAYQDFLMVWHDADPDIPILKDARSEYAKLQ
jgi:tetratricopeptide (TPR) repeat protein/predicted Ser/Thr protein kinase